MTLSYTTPTEPTFYDFEIPTRISVDVPELPTSDIDFETFDKDSIQARLLAFSYTRYGQVFQDIIDDSVTDLLSWSNDIEADAKFGIIKEQILHGAQLEAERIMDVTASRGFMMAPGRTSKALYDIDIKSKQALADASWELFLSRLNLAQNHVEFALKAGTSKEAALFDHHNKVQMLNLEAAVAVAKAGHESYQQNAERYNKEIEEFEISARAFQAQQKARTFELEAFLAQLDGVTIEAKAAMRESEIFKAGIALTDMQNRVKLADLRVTEVTAKTQKAALDVYHSELYEYTANIESILADYKEHRLTVEQSAAEMKAYLRKLDLNKAQIRNKKAELDKDAEEARQNLVESGVELERWKADLDQMEQVLDNARLIAQKNETDHEIFLLQQIENIKDDVSDDINAFELALNARLAAKNAEISQAVDNTNYNIGVYRVESDGDKSGIYDQWKAHCKKKAADFMAKADQTLNLTQTITEGS